jgi:hypothetical protein
MTSRDSETSEVMSLFEKHKVTTKALEIAINQRPVVDISPKRKRRARVEMNA